MKKILITGATGSIGQVLAKNLDKDYDLLLLDKDKRSLEQLDKQLSSDPVLIPFDLLTNQPENYQNLAQMIEQDHGYLDALIFLSGHFDHLRPIIHISEIEWLKTIQINLTSPLWLTQRLLPLLLKSDNPKIIFTRFPQFNQTQKAYWHSFAISQAGLDQLIQLLELEKSAYPNLSIASVSPPWLDSELTRRIFPNGKKDWLMPENIVSLYLDALNSNYQNYRDFCLKLND